MPLFTWKKEFRTGLADIDAQHKIFLSYLNQCYDAVTKNKLTGVPPDLIRKLKKYAEIHFSFEEEMMEFNGFPELAKHKELHQHFTNEILKLEKSRLSGESTATLKSVLAMMRDWFLNHIIVEDKKLLLYL
jgi:hemerythrin